ncbi:MAG: SH3 domain-containing protein, partial [Bacillota bacterium]
MKKKVLLPSICFAVLSTAAFDQVVKATENSTPVSTASQANITHFVKISPGTNLNLRASASTSASIVGSLANGTQVTVYSNENGWAKVLANGKTGFVSSNFLTPKNGGSSSTTTPKEEAKTSTQYVNIKAGSKLNLRASASTSA